MEIICIINTDVTIKTHPTDNSKIIIAVNGIEYVANGNDVITAVNAVMSV